MKNSCRIDFNDSILFLNPMLQNLNQTLYKYDALNLGQRKSLRNPDITASLIKLE